jgi:DNA-binding Lrp family transcriptional regulator
MKLDEKNCKILDLLQTDCRMSLTKIAQEVNLSVDSVKKRINKMIANNIFYPKIQLRPRNFGFNNIVDVKMKLRNHTMDDMRNFTDYLKKHSRVAEIFAVSGNWDYSIVLIAKNGEDLGYVSEEIRNKFNHIISDWAESLTTFAHKFEEYDMIDLMHNTRSDNK